MNSDLKDAIADVRYLLDNGRKTDECLNAMILKAHAVSERLAVMKLVPINLYDSLSFYLQIPYNQFNFEKKVNSNQKNSIVGAGRS